MKIKIKVTKEILKESMFCSYNSGDEYNNRDGYETNCAIAKAIIQLLPGAFVDGDNILFYSSYVTYQRKQPLVKIELPWSAKIFIEDFDIKTPEKRAEMDPIGFEIDVPEYLIDRIGLSEVHRILKESKTLELCP